MHILWVAYDQGFLFVVIRTSLHLSIHFLLQENQKFFIFSKMILRVMPKFLPILLVLGASVVQFSTQKFFRSSQCINYAFKTSPRNHSFATKWFRVSQVIVIFLCGCTKSKSVIFTSLRQSITISKLAHMWDFAPFFDFRCF